MEVLPAAPLSQPGYNILTTPISPHQEPYKDPSPASEEAYERYLRIHKVFVGLRGARQLEEIYTTLEGETSPQHLGAAGWAAIEAALVREDKTATSRLDLVHGGVDCWMRAVQQQKALNEQEEGELVEYVYPHRLALDIAVSPLFEGIVLGGIAEATCKEVFEDCLAIAASNAVKLKLMAKEHNEQGLAEHIGLGYECNGLLASNRMLSPTRFVVPSMARADTGYYHRQQTHDLLVIHQEWGKLMSVTPVEVKSKASLRDRERYLALLVRGKMHLSMTGRYTPEDTLQAIIATYEGSATKEEKLAAETITERFVSMVKAYYAGDKLGHVATSRSVTMFHDNSQVVANYPGLGARALAS